MKNYNNYWFPAVFCLFLSFPGFLGTIWPDLMILS
jgi:hypothetical protein